MNGPSTRYRRIDPQNPEPDLLAEAAVIIRRGGLVAFPTETVYGLGADALNPAAVRRIFAAKERPANDPIIVHVLGMADLARLTWQAPSIAGKLAGRFWPGALTLVLRRSEIVPDEITAGGPTVAVRSPAHPVARALIRAAGTPIGAPSANRFGRTSPTTAEHVRDELNGRIDLVLDGGPTQIGVESTVLDLTGSAPVILRPGGVSHEALEAVIGPVAVLAGSRAETTDEPQPSPGLLERHYAPGTPLRLVGGPDNTLSRRLAEVVTAALSRGEKVAVLAAEEDLPFLDGSAAVIGCPGSLEDLKEVARRLYDTLRVLDAAGVDVILARDFPPEGLGLAIRDRLRRAAVEVV